MTQYHNLVSKVEWKSMQEGLLYCSMAFKATKGQKMSIFKLVILVVYWFNIITATDSEVGWAWVEAATNTFGELAPHLVCVVTGQSPSRRFQ